MEYNELLAHTRDYSSEAPSTASLLAGVHRAEQRRRESRTRLLGIALAACTFVPVALTATLQSRPAPIILAEEVSLSQNATGNELPATLKGYIHSTRNHQIINAL